MELKRLLRVLQDRWYVIVGVGLLGLFAGWYFTNLANDNREEKIKATIAIRFEAQEGQTADALESERDATLGRAMQAAASLLTEDKTSVIEIDDVTGLLVFRAIGNSNEEAAAKAGALVKAYLAVDPTAGGPVDERLADVLESAATIQEQIDELQIALTPEQQALANRHALLDQQIVATTDALIQALVEEESASAADTPAVTARRQRLQEAVDDLKAESMDH